ncbi:MAG: hypothetical protein MUC52_01005 [Candidatus Omnitrophica bacterium]|jgi:hypothetical protein|nr:hypothetical protein [Candidatus Omnitrophota bacterium]
MNVLRSLINRIFGNTQIFIIILSWFLIISGLLMIWKPDYARKSLAGRGFGIFKAYLVMLALFLGGFLVSAINRLNGFLALLVLIAGLLLLYKGFVFLQKTAAQKIGAWVEKIPLKYIKIYAVIQVLTGFVMQALRQRILF